MNNATADPSSCELKLGPMYSGKTEALIHQYGISLGEGKRIVSVKPKIDNRYSESEIVSHGGKGIPACSVSNIQTEISDSEWDVMLIDEGQFMPELADFCRKLLLKYPYGKHIYIAVLSGTAEGKPWPVVSELLPLASEISWLQAECAHCKRPAAYTARFTSGPTVDVGGSDKYWPACTRCFYAHINKAVVS